ncbi:vacuolar sorting protein VPS33/slp1 [Rhizoclosmatium sp. JEL0117]|nr:vacuolar sorting protein VPS33/slp1 [Rhizoclosmatium sp. JEL0117]
MSSIQEILRARVLTQIITQVKPIASKWKVVIMDSLARKVINSCVKMTDILELNVTIVEMLELRRTPFPDQDAVYLLAPTPESVELLLADYTRGKPPYAAAHLFFISALSDTLFEKIQKSPIQRHVHSLKELNMDFLAIEPQAFSLDLPGALPSIINAQTASHMNYELAPVAKRLVSVLATLGEYPYIRYYSPPTPTITPNSSNAPLIEKFAKLVQDELDELARIDKSFPPQTTYPRAILLLVDRGADVVAPLLHEFTYQAMVNDCLALEEGNKFPNKSEEGKLATLDDSDKIWVSQKYTHIAEVMEFLPALLKKFTAENKAANFATGKGGSDIADMKDTLQAMPEFQEMKSKFSLHTDICQECMAVFNKYNHHNVSTVEQELATGENSDFKPSKNILGAVTSLLSNRTICHEDKIRLLMLHIIMAEGLPDAERQQLFDIVKLSRDENQAITNLSVLGVRLSESIVKRGGANPYAFSNLKGARGRVKEVKFENSRYIPIIKHMLEDQAKNTLDPAVFPWVKEPPPSFGRSGGRGATGGNRGSYEESGTPRTKGTWATSRAGGSSLNRGASSKESSSLIPGSNRLDANVLRNNGPRIILFMLGGMTFSEMRSANEIMVENQREVLIGSTHVLNPHSFLDTLKNLHKRGGVDKPSPHPYDTKPELSPPTSPRSKSRGAESRRGDDGGRRRDDDPRVQKSRSEGRIDRYREDDRDPRDARAGPSSRGRDDRGPERSGSRSQARDDVYRNGSYRDDERSNSSRQGYRTDDRDGRSTPAGRGDREYGKMDRYGSEPAMGGRTKSRDERERDRGGRRDELSDRMERTNLDQPVKKSGWLGGLFGGRK